jgi:hypothetical protein
MATFKLTVTTTVVTAYEYEYEVRDVESPAEAEAIFRHPNGSAHKMKLIRKDEVTVAASREEVPVVISRKDETESAETTESNPLSVAQPGVAELQ